MSGHPFPIRFLISSPNPLSLLLVCHVVLPSASTFDGRCICLKSVSLICSQCSHDPLNGSSLRSRFMRSALGPVKGIRVRSGPRRPLGKEENSGLPLIRHICFVRVPCSTLSPGSHSTAPGPSTPGSCDNPVAP